MQHLGGSMYGDGEYVVSFEGVSSCHAPLDATVMTTIDGRTVGYSVKGLDRAFALRDLAKMIVTKIKATRPS